MSHEASGNEYRPLMTSVDGLEKASQGSELYLKKSRLPSRRTLAIVAIVQALALLCTIPISVLSVYRTEARLCPKALYSPAQHVVEYKVKTFHVGFDGDKTSFQGPPSPELDASWSDLYNFGISRIPKTQAALLANKTQAIPDDPGNYIVELDVFHQLHCLNMIRKALNPVHYPDMHLEHPQDAQDNADHISHCVDSIRQSLMCSSDISTIVWQWSESLQKVIVKGNVAHTCRNFDRIRDWAKERTLRTEHDVSMNVEDGIIIPIYH